MTATNMCSNFGGFRCSPPLSIPQLNKNTTMVTRTRQAIELILDRPLVPLGHIGEFDSTVENMSTYLERLQLYFMANQVERDLQAATLLGYVGGKTYRVLKNLLAPTFTPDPSINTDH